MPIRKGPKLFNASRIGFDVATALSRGARDTQEDAVVADFSIGDGVGVVVLADGMGGHEAGEVASTLVMSEVFRSLKLSSRQLLDDPECAPEILRTAAQSANACLRDHTMRFPETQGMGSTLISLVQIDTALFWISIGDSVLYLFRDGELKQLNEDHSLAPQIDYMVRQGMISEEAGRNHPDRNMLTSALHGEPIRRTDCPEKPLMLRSGDLIIAASDGLTFLDTSLISESLAGKPDTHSATLSRVLLKAIKKLHHPDQDNVSFAMIRVTDGQSKGTRPKPDDKGVQDGAQPESEHSTSPELSSFLTADAPRNPLINRLYTLGAGLLR